MSVHFLPEPAVYAGWARESSPEIAAARAEDLGEGRIVVHVAGAFGPVSSVVLERAQRCLDVRAPLCVSVTVCHAATAEA